MQGGPLGGRGQIDRGERETNPRIRCLGLGNYQRGGTVTVTGIVSFQDGLASTQTWFHRYNPIPPPPDDWSNPEPPEPGPVPR